MYDQPHDNPLRPALAAPPQLAPAPQPVVVSPQLPESLAPAAAPVPVIEVDLEGAPPKGGRRKAAGVGRQRALILRTARKTMELHAIDPIAKGLLSAILNTTANADDLAYAVIVGGTKSIQPATDALSILDADALEAGVHAAALGRARLRQVWRVFTELDVVTGEAPASDAKAAIALVRAIHEGETDEMRSDIDAAIALTKK